MKYHFKIHKAKDGFWADCVELKGCMSQGDTLDELKTNCKDALALYIEEPEDSKQIFPMPKKNLSKKRGILAVELDPPVALAFLLRQDRLRSGKNQTMIAKELGFKNLYSYQILENSKKLNPELKTLVLLKKVFPKINFDEILAA